MTLINIAAIGKQPVFIPTDGVTALIFDPYSKDIAVRTAKGTLIHQEAANLLPITDIAKKLEDAGNPLHYFPSHYEDTGNDIPCYVQPSAVQCMTVSQPDDKGMHAVIMIIQGSGYRELYNLSKAQIDDLAAAVRAEKTFLSYEPAIAQARWHKPESLYIAPQDLIRITHDSRHQLNIYFDSGSIDVQTSHLDWDQRNQAIGGNNQNLQDAANRLMKTKKNVQPEDLKELFNKMQAKANFFKDKLDQSEARASKALARELAAYVPDMIEIDAVNTAFYRKDAIGHIHTHSDKGSYSLSISPIQGMGASYSDRFSLWFKSEDHFSQALVKLEQDLTSKKTAPKPPAP